MNVSVFSFFFFFKGYGDPRDLPSFPTRRSSDLAGELQHPQARVASCVLAAHECVQHRRPDVSCDLAVDIGPAVLDRKSTRLNSSHVRISYAVFCLKKKKLLAPPRK